LSAAKGARSINPQGPRRRIEGFTIPTATLNIEVAYDSGTAAMPRRNYISDPDEWSNLFHEGPAGSLADSFPRRAGRGRDRIDRPEILPGAAANASCDRKPFDIVGSNLYVVHQRVAQKFRLGARSSPAIPRT